MCLLAIGALCMFSNGRPYLGPDLPSGLYTGIPWQAGLRTGSALEAEDDRIAVKEAGFYFVYSQVDSITVNPSFNH